MSPVLILFIAAVAFLLGGASAVFSYYLHRDNTGWFRRTKGTIVDFAVVKTEHTGTAVTETFALTATGGFILRGYIRTPAERGKYPVIFMSGGLFTGKEVLNLLDDVSGVEPFIAVSIDYPYKGEKRIGGRRLIRNIPRIRRAAMDTVRGSLLLLEKLKELESADRERLYAAGVSFGSFFALAAVACDPDVKCAASLFGGAKIHKLIAVNLPFRIPGVNALIGRIASWTVRPLEPLRYAPLISPRPLLIVAGKGDARFPADCADALYDAALDPKELLWFESAHPEPTRNELVEELVVVVARWMGDNELLREADDEQCSRK